MHKRFPEEYNLTPPACPRPDKTLCDLDPRNPKITRKFPKAESVRLLTKAVQKGLYSDTLENGFPKRIWAVNEDGIVYEAKLDNPEQGTYHGYPLASKQRDLIVCISSLWNS